MPISKPDPIVPNPNVVYQEVAGETVLLNLDNECYYGLDPVGSRVWELISEKSSTDMIIERLACEFEASKAQIKNDVAELLRQLEQDGLINS